MTHAAPQISQAQLMNRSSGILADCSQSCLRLQDALSVLLAAHAVPPESILDFQALDRLYQQLADLSRVLSACASHPGCRALDVTEAVHALSTLSATRTLLLSCPDQTSMSGNVELF